MEYKYLYTSLIAILSVILIIVGSILLFTLSESNFKNISIQPSIEGYNKGIVNKNNTEWRIKTVDISSTNLKLPILLYSEPCLNSPVQETIIINGYNSDGNQQSITKLPDCFLQNEPNQIPDSPSAKPSNIISENEIFYNYYYKKGDIGLFDSDWKINIINDNSSIMQFKYDIRENSIQFSWVFINPDFDSPSMFTINTHSISDIAKKINTDSNETTYTLKLEDINTINGGAILIEDIVGETIFPTITLIK